MMSRILLRALPIVATALLGACSSATTDVLPPTVSVSIGQQLIDLKKAKEAGAISEQEYQTQVKRVVDSVQ
jgi:outer membrane biogenesis lipoprotein LolB